MIKDYSQLPANKRIVNDKDEDITISLRDKCIMVPVTIKVNESLSVKATTSEDLALINKQCEEFELPLEDEGPDITDIVVTITPNIREGEDNSKANAIIATLSLKGGTEPVEYTLSGTDADKFILENNIVKAKNDLVEGTYSITLSALDSTKETYSETDEINVLAAYPLITDATISFESDIREGETNAQAGAVVGTISATGGTEPITYSIPAEYGTKIVVEGSNLKVGSAPLTEDTYSFSVKATDVHNKTFTKAAELIVLAAYPEITSFTVSPTGGLEEGNANVQADAVVATMSVEGGSAPITYSFKEDELNGADNASFKIDGANLKVGETPLVTKEYKVSLTATDTHGKTKDQTATISVAAPNITSLNAQLTSGLEEGNENVAANAKIADLSTTGGIAPYTYSLNTLVENTVVANLSSVGGIAPYTYSLKADTQDNAEFTIEGTTVKNIASIDTAGTKNITVVVTDKNSTTKEQTAQIEISAASE